MSVVGLKASITFDASKPDGTPRKLMDSSRLLAMGWKPKITLQQGLTMAYQSFLRGEVAARAAPQPSIGRA
jgi:GDP-L-fucose synthase